ncbi:myelin expression factor 2 isoform X1 [Anastrepha obliqua]|uniref:myelin expression factor 2 isoform X1 n=1 Tax=Anastrepha ludens TaxID=28586 RepID=UPI0023B1C433|nr:myelin expression factor 2 isoform X1 [Anastrepha ludens]XP_054741530.1 myelin expression factor 2 isoform X1 [Anastrepha obliqua]
MKSEGNENSNDSREKERDRRGRGARASRFSDADASGGGSGGAGGSSNSGGNANRDRSRERRNCRVYISNIPYDYRWQDLKDLFRRIVGSVEYVELFHDENGKARGCGIVEFKDPDNVEKALEKMNRYEINGRELVVKEDHGEQRDQYGRIVRDGGGSVRGGGGGGGMVGGDMGDRDRGFSRRDDDRSGRNNFNMMSNDFNNSSNYNLYGLSASFLESLGISGPLHNKVFVANLDYKVDTKKLKQVFKLAGKVQSVDLSVDKEGNSRGFAVVEYDHPVEAVQAISMLDRQMLFDRRMTVRLDRIPDKGEGLKLPEGLGGVGIGLGPNGEPLKDVARNLPSIIQQQQNQPTQAPMSSQGGGGSNILGNMVANLSGGGAGGGGNSGMFNNQPVQPSPVAPVVQAAAKSLSNNSAGLNLGNLSSTNLAALSNVVGGLGAALSNPLLTTSLSNLGLNLGQSSGGNDDSMSSANAALSNNYSTGGNNYPSGFGSSGFNSGSGGNTGGGGGFNAYNTGSGNSGGGGGAMDGNDYSGGGGSMDMYVGGGSGGGNAGNVGNNPRKSDTIIIKNIPLSCTWQTLRDKFRDVGEVKFAEIRGNDLGVVRFFKERDAELAIALMDGSRMDGRTIKVTYF